MDTEITLTAEHALSAYQALHTSESVPTAGLTMGRQQSLLVLVSSPQQATLPSSMELFAGKHSIILVSTNCCSTCLGGLD